MKNIKPILLTGLIATVPALAMAQFTVGDSLGTTDEEIRAAVEAKGYVIEEIEREDGEIEVEVLIDGVETELTLAIVDGVLLDIETEGDDTDDD
ncbi:MAG: PepSY domain-containing protein [Pseudomonadota bacterium]